MANPMPEEDKLYQQIKSQKLKMHPVHWALLNHHVRNNLNMISVAAGSLRLEPEWILKMATKFINILHWISRQPGSPPAELTRICDACLTGAKETDKFLRELRQVTCSDQEESK